MRQMSVSELLSLKSTFSLFDVDTWHIYYNKDLNSFTGIHDNNDKVFACTFSSLADLLDEIKNYLSEGLHL